MSVRQTRSHSGSSIINYEHIWTIGNISKYFVPVGKCIKTDFLKVRPNLRVRFSLYPSGKLASANDHVSVYMKVYSASIILGCQLKCAIIDENGDESGSQEKMCVMDGSSPHGFLQFFDRLTILSDKIILKFSVCFLVDYTSIVHDEIRLPFSSTFPHLFLDPSLSDFAIVCEGNRFPTHRSILMAKSSIFYAMLSRVTLENSIRQVQIVDFRWQVVKEMLRFIYCGYFLNMPELAFEMLTISNKYNLHILKLACEKFIETNLSVENAVIAFLSAEDLEADYLKKASANFIICNLPQIKETADWKRMIRERQASAINILLTITPQ
jgi:hypothetical protein